MKGEEHKVVFSMKHILSQAPDQGLDTPIHTAQNLYAANVIQSTVIPYSFQVYKWSFPNYW